MTVHRLLQNAPPGPEDISRLVEAYDRALYLPDRDNPITRMVAKAIIEIGQTGIRDPDQISELALRKLER